MYIAVKGGQAAIEASRDLLAAARRGDLNLPALGVDQVREQLSLGVGRVMAKASLIDPELAALALVQAQGDAIEVAFLLRAYRSSLPRLAFSVPLNCDAMRSQRRISAIFRGLPVGQVLGPTFDDTQRLLDFELLRGGAKPAPAAQGMPKLQGQTELPNALQALSAQGLVEPAQLPEGDPEPQDITRDPPRYPLPRSARLQMLAPADEGWVLGLAYPTQRGYAFTHPFAGDIRFGAVTVQPDELAFEIGELELTECQMLNQFVGSAKAPPQFTRGYSPVYGHGERKAMAMAMSLLDRALRSDEFGERAVSPAQQQEFALPQGDSVEASGFVQHLKLPHYVTFEAELQLIRQLHEQHQNSAAGAPTSEQEQAP